MMNRGCRGALLALVIALVLTVTAGPPLRQGDGLHGTPTPLTQGIGERLSIASGDGQTAPAGTVFPTPLTVLLLDYNGTPMAGEGVLFSLVEGPSPTHLEGGGHLGAAVTVQTNETGLARARLHGGDGEGRIRVNVTWGNETVMFTAFTARVVAHLTMEGENVTGAMILFDANNSKGNISGYVFDFGDGARSGLRVVPRVIHVYTRSGTYRVEVIVYDARNITDVATLLVTIREREREAAMTPYLAWGVEAALFLLLAAALYAFGHSHLRTQIARIRRVERVPADDFFEMAVSHALAGERERAITYFRKVIREDPHNASAHFYMGIVLMELRRYRAARAALRRALEIDPDFRMAQEALQALLELRSEGR